MKNRNIKSQAILFALAFALAPIAQGEQRPDGGPATVRVTPTPRPRPTAASRSMQKNKSEDERSTPAPRQRPTAAPRPVVDVESESPADPISAEEDLAVTIHSSGDVKRGKIGSFVIKMNPVMFGGLYVNFKVSGTAAAGVDYVPLVSPTYIGRSGYGVILVNTLANPRGSAIRQAYSLRVTLEPGPGYEVGELNSAKMMIKD